MDTNHHHPLISPSAQAGGRAHIKGTGITVDDIISSYQIILDAKIIEELRTWFPHLSEEQIRAALEYYRDNPGEIDERLRQDRAVWHAYQRKAD